MIKMKIPIKRKNVFWQFFINFFVLIIIPTLFASIFIYVYFAQMVEKEVEEANTLIMENFVKTTDDVLRGIRSEVIQLLSTSAIDEFIGMRWLGQEVAGRAKVIHKISNQLNTTLGVHDMIDDIYIYFPRMNTVVSDTGYFNSKDFFEFHHHMPNLSVEQSRHMFSGNKMMDFTEVLKINNKDYLSGNLMSSGHFVSVITSYPFHSDFPEAYLVVSISQEKLKEIITLDSRKSNATAVIDGKGNLISYTGEGNFNADKINEQLNDKTQGAFNEQINEQSMHISYITSSFNKWRYLILTDNKELQAPANLIKTMAVLFLLLFLCIGIILSYFLSKKMYIPIREITSSFEQFGGGEALNAAQSHNEFDFIKKWSNTVMMQNKAMMMHMNGMKPIIHEHFIRKVLNGEFQDELSIQYYAKDIDLDLKTEGDFVVICIEIQYHYEMMKKLSETDKSFLLIELTDTLSKNLEEQSFFAQMDENVLACMINLGKHSSVNKKGLIVTEKIKDILENYHSYFYAAISNGAKETTIKKLQHSYLQAYEYINLQKFQPGIKIIDTSTVRNKEQNLMDGYLSKEEMNRINHFIILKSTKQLAAEIEQILKKAMGKKGTKLQMIKLSKNILNILIRETNLEKDSFTTDNYLQLLEKLDYCSELVDLIKFFEEACSLLIVETSEEENSKEALIGEVLEYIHNHSNEDISLEFFADQYNMSLGHFSRTFKEVVGEKYVDYVTKVNITKAKELLLETDIKIAEISSAVGYSATNSFIKIFKRYEGLTPGKYRSTYKN